MAWSSDGALEVLKLQSEETYPDMKTINAKSSNSARGLNFEGKRAINRIEYCGGNMW